MMSSQAACSRACASHMRFSFPSTSVTVYGLPCRWPRLRPTHIFPHLSNATREKSADLRKVRIVSAWKSRRRNSNNRVKYSWTQPICEACWEERHHGLPAGRLKHPSAETCVWCGQRTMDGIYIRVDPSTAPHPSIRKE